MAATLTADECLNALRSRFSKTDGFVSLTELTNLGGAAPNMIEKGVGRRADFWAMCTFASRGFETHGVEIKVRRDDLRRELQDPSKAEAHAEFCDYWWLAVGDREILDGLRIPDAWGILWPRGDQLIEKEPPERTPSSEEWDRAFVAALVKRCWKEHPEKKIRKLKSDHRQELREAKREARKQGKRSNRKKYDRLKKRVEDFERVSGIDLDGYPGRYGVREDVGRYLGAAVKILMTGGDKVDSHLNKLRREAKRMESDAESLRNKADTLEEFVDDLGERQLDLLDEDPREGGDGE